ncbi:MAG: M20/M25/M40 family metallo-hydrolase, partial [Propionibacteriaceae bacterium]|nr:M20/M25/M40 family metallo-hydrolase [Propionibacteriaceae bacterium]
MKGRARAVVVAAAAGVVCAAVVAAVVLVDRPMPPQPVDSRELRAAITPDGVAAHLAALQRIADAHGGNRAAGTPGYEASLDYVEARLVDAGYRPQRQRFSYERPDFTGASLQRTLPSRTDYTVLRDFRPLAFSGAGSVTAPVTAVDLNLDGSRATTSGCEAADFGEFPRGHIALVQRGTCPFREKVDHATAAGAGAVLILNQGNDASRLGLFAGTLGRTSRIPVVATTFDLGAEWAAAPGTTLRLDVEATVTRITTENLIADTADGATDRTVVVGAHLDGVPEGPGINDNGSGVAAVLETAVRFAELGIEPRNRVRFAFWGGEEDGLYGSRHYVSELDDPGRRGTAVYLNLDMVGSPRPVASVYGGGDPGSGWPAGSGAVQTVLTDFLTAQGVTPATVTFRESDHASFLDAGIPVGGLFTGADGGADPCYHKA